GIGWNFKIMMIRVEEPGWGYAYLDDLLQGARWAADNGAKTVSTSYSGVDYAGVGTTGTYCKNRGTLHLYAAGNDGRDLSWFDYPNTIVVGASHSGEDRAGWSAYGKAVDVFAPGESILSSCIGGGWCYASGTSMATPVANGVCAMIWAARPSLTAQQVENILFATCKDWGAPGNDDVYGWGRVDTYDAVKAAVSFGSNHPVAVDDNAGKILAGASLRIDVLANDFDPQSQPISIVGFSPASGLGGTVSLSTGTGPGGRDELLYQAPAVGPGMDTFTYTIQDSTGLTDGATVRLQVMTLDEFRVPENPNYPMPGVEGRYYALSSPTQLPDFSVLTPIVVKVRPDININAGGGVFGDSGLADNVGAVFEGWLLVPADDVYTLYANSDDGSRLLIGDTVVVSNDGLHGPVEAGGEIALRAGRHRIRVEYFEAGGGATLVVSIAGGGLSKQVIPSWMWSHGDFADSDFLDPASPGVTRPGLDANYYATTLFITTLPNFAALTPYLVTSVDMLNYAPTSGVFANSGRSDAVAALFTGFVTVGETGFHTFYSNSDEGSRVYVGGHLVVDNNGLHTMQERSGMIGLKAGTHALRVEYFERTGSCGLIVSHQGPSTPKAVIAAAALSRVNPCPADFDGSGFVDTDDFDAFVAAFEAGGNDADFDGSGFVDTDDFDSFVGAFTLGC
ncbi:MAG TPA: PA14 domain-containing protein, partial [Phycisphaerales bacterium]|nr:PA14 domain-containing protein [Phycisphaerales bacterium]